tara:strand:+ start:1109 stop:1537 length:429 start_codon:yes stop_codon:yes gene_type:complete
MELLYFISGILTVGTIYGVLLFRQIKSSHTTLLEEINQHKDSTHDFTNNMDTELLIISNELENISGYYTNVKNQMEEDNYEGNVKLNQRITDIATEFNRQGNGNKQLFDTIDEMFKKTNNDISQLKLRTKGLGDNRNAIDRY